MRTLFDTKYAPATTLTPNNSSLSETSLNDTIRSVTRSMLDADFDDDEEGLDEIERYTSEKPANKEIDVLAWWKVSDNSCLLK
jgi:hypothetical protein